MAHNKTIFFNNFVTALAVSDNTMYGKIRSNVCPFEIQYQKFSLSELMKNQFLKLELPSLIRKGHAGVTESPQRA